MVDGRWWWATLAPEMVYGRDTRYTALAVNTCMSSWPYYAMYTSWTSHPIPIPTPDIMHHASAHATAHCSVRRYDDKQRTLINLCALFGKNCFCHDWHLSDPESWWRNSYYKNSTAAELEKQRRGLCRGRGRECWVECSTLPHTGF